MSVPVRPVGPVSPVLMGSVLNCWRLKKSRRPQKEEADECISCLVLFRRLLFAVDHLLL